MADTAGSAGEVRVRLALDASDLKTQITRAEQEVGSGKGIELQVKLADDVVNSINAGIPAPKDLAPVMLTGDIDTATTITTINASVKKNISGNLKPVELPVVIKMSKADQALLTKLGNVTKARSGVNVTATAEPRQTRPRKAKAAGGAYQMGDELVVGEEGPELIRMNAPGGTVIPTRNVPRPVQRQRHAGGWSIDGHVHSRDGSQWKHPRTGVWYPTIVRTQTAARAWADRGRYRETDPSNFDAPIGTPYKSMVVPMGQQMPEESFRQLWAMRKYDRQGARHVIRAARHSDTMVDRMRTRSKYSWATPEEEAADAEFQMGGPGVVELPQPKNITPGGAPGDAQEIKRYRVRASISEVKRGVRQVSSQLTGGKEFPALSGKFGPIPQKIEELRTDPGFTSSTALHGGQSELSIDPNDPSVRAGPQGYRLGTRRAQTIGEPVAPGDEREGRAGTVRRRGEVRGALTEGMEGLSTTERAAKLAHSPNISGDWESRSRLSPRAVRVKRRRGEYRPAHSTGLRSMTFDDPLEWQDPSVEEGQHARDAAGMAYAVGLLQAAERRQDRRPRPGKQPYVSSEMMQGVDPSGVGRRPTPFMPIKYLEGGEVELAPEYEDEEWDIAAERPGERSPYGPYVSSRRKRGLIPLHGTGRARRSAKMALRRESQRELDAQFRRDPYGFVGGIYTRHLEPEPADTDEQRRNVQLINEEALALLEEQNVQREFMLETGRKMNPQYAAFIEAFRGPAKLLETIHGMSPVSVLTPRMQKDRVWARKLYGSAPELTKEFQPRPVPGGPSYASGFIGRTDRKRLNAISPYLGTLMAKQQRNLARAARRDDPRDALKDIAKVEGIARLIQAKYVEGALDAEEAKGKRGKKPWSELDQEERETFRLGEEAIDQISITDDEAALIYGTADPLERGMRTKTPKALRGLRQVSNYKRDPMGTVKYNRELTSILDSDEASEGRESAYRKARRFSIQEELENAEQRLDDKGAPMFVDDPRGGVDEKGKPLKLPVLELAEPDLGALVYRASVGAIKHQRRIAAAGIRGEILEQEIALLEDARKEAKTDKEKDDLSEQKKALSADLRAVRDISFGVVRKGEMSRASGGMMGGPLMQRLARNKIQQAYDAGDYAEGQRLQKELEAAKGGWGEPQQQKPAWRRRIEEGRGFAKEMGRALGGAMGKLRSLASGRELDEFLSEHSEITPGDPSTYLYSRWTPDLEADMRPGATSGGIANRSYREKGISVTPVHGFATNQGLPFSTAYDMGPTEKKWAYRGYYTGGANAKVGRGDKSEFAERQLYMMRGTPVGEGADGEPVLDPESIRPLAHVSREAIDDVYLRTVHGPNSPHARRRFGGGLAARIKGAIKGANYSGGAHPSTLSDIEDIAQRATSITNVGEHGPEKIVHLPEGDFVVPAHQTAQFDRALGSGTGAMNHGVMADWPKGQPMSPWVRDAAAGRLRAKETYGRHEGGSIHGHPHPPDKFQDGRGAWHEVGTGRMTSAPENWDPARGTNEGMGGLFGGATYGRRGRPTDVFTSWDRARAEANTSFDYQGINEGVQQRFPGLDAPGITDPARLIPAQSRSRGINVFGGAGGSQAYAVPQVMAMGGVHDRPITLGHGGINARGGAFGHGYGYGPFQNAGILPAQAQSLVQQGREAGEAMREGFDATGTGQSAGQAMNEALRRQRNATGPDQRTTVSGAEQARARLAAAGGLPTGEEEMILGQIGLGANDDIGSYAYSDKISGIRSRISEQLSLTPVRALSVSIGQIAQQALGGRAEIQARAAAANAKAARAQRSAGYLENIQVQRGAAQFELETGDATGLFEDQEGEEEGAGAKRRDALKKQISKFEAQEAYAEPTVRKQVAEAEAASRNVASRGQKLTAQTLGVVGIVGGTLLFSTAMQVAQKAVTMFAEAAMPAVDALTSFEKTANQTATELSKSVRGSSGAGVAVAAQQAQLGIGISTPALTQQAALLAGSQSAAELQRQIRAEDNLSQRDPLRGITEDFRNGLFAGIPGLEALSFIGQDQSLSERIRGSLQSKPTVATTAELEAAFGITPQTVTTDEGVDVQVGSGPSAFESGMDPAISAILRQAVEESRSGVSMTDDERQARVEEIMTAEDPRIAEVQAQQQAALDSYTKRADLLAEGLDAGLQRVSGSLGTFERVLEPTSDAVKKTYDALAPFDKELAESLKEADIALTGVRFKEETDLAGLPVGNTVTEALTAAQTGLGQLDAGKLLESMENQIAAQLRATGRQAQFQQQTQIPAQFATGLIRDPLQTSGAQGLFSQNPIDLLGFGDQGTGSLDDWAQAIQGVLDEAEALKQVGLSELFGTLKVPEGAVSDVERITRAIRDLNEYSEDLNLGIEQERYNEQLRITQRNIGDLVGLNGRSAAQYEKLADLQADVTDEGLQTSRSYEQQVIQATRLGQLNRAQIDDQREVARLSRLQALDQRELARISLARNQREINLQLALARLKAPGETPQERAVRQREAELRAREAQRELDINKRTTERGFGIEDIQYGIQIRGFTIQDIELKRQLDDALRAAGLDETERAIRLELRGVEKFTKASQAVLTQASSTLDSFIEVGTAFETQALGVQSTIEAQAGELAEGFADEVADLFRPIKREVRETLSIVDGGVDRSSNQGRTKDQGGRAAGGIFDTKGATRFLAGEAGNESVVVLRGVKSGMLSGGPAGGGVSGGRSVTININNPTVRNEGDIDRLVDKVKRALHDEAELVGAA